MKRKASFFVVVQFLVKQFKISRSHTYILDVITIARALMLRHLLQLWFKNKENSPKIRSGKGFAPRFRCVGTRWTEEASCQAFN